MILGTPFAPGAQEKNRDQGLRSDGADYAKQACNISGGKGRERKDILHIFYHQKESRIV